MVTPKTFEELREYMWEERSSALDCMIDRMDEELAPYELGKYRGEIAAYDNILLVLKNCIKYGDIE